ncbi:MAG: DUF4838 domain-containing protein [Kiritimatiellae bacterium]|nr:DUF4838 domain-containing protein [Kiritimatiellia bacterium]
MQKGDGRMMNRRQPLGLLFGALGALAAAQAAAGEFALARDGRPAAAIVVPAGAVPAARFAAGELASYLGRMCGGAFTVVTNGVAESGRSAIIVGGPYAPPAGTSRWEEVVLSVADGALHVTGEGPRGPLYAAYELLERLGCGFWSPLVETVPERRTITVPDNLDYAYAPPFRLRHTTGGAAVYNPLWNPKARLNRHGSIPEERGGCFRVDMAESMLGLNQGKYAFEMFKEHPEWYGVGKSGHRQVGQLCTSNREALDKLVELARARLEKKPDTEFLSISFADKLPPCACPDCRALAKAHGSQAALLLAAVNHVARALAADYPNLKITFLAYGPSMPLPKGVEVAPNAWCVFAHLDRNFGKSFQDSKNSIRLIDGWRRLCQGRMYVWGYGAAFGNYLMPTPTVDLLGSEFRAYRDRGVAGVSSQLSEGAFADFIELRCWLYGKLAWNPDLDEWALIHEWCAGACGKGAPYIEKWLRRQKEIRETPPLKWLRPYDVANFNLFTADELLEGEALLAQALEATADDARAHALVERLYGGMLSCLLIRYNIDVARAAAKRGIKDFPSRLDCFRRYEALSRKYGNNCFSERFDGTSFLNRIRHGEITRTPNRARLPWTLHTPVSETPVQDPFVTFDKASGRYYLLASEDDRITLRRARTARGLLFEAEERVVFTGGAAAPIADTILAPEMHRAENGKWYIYASGSDGIAFAEAVAPGEEKAPVDDVALIEMGLDDVRAETAVGGGNARKYRDTVAAAENRLFVLESKTKDPFDGFVFKGLLDKTISAVDPTVFIMPDGRRYMCYARQGAGTSLVMREMDGPCAFAGEGVEILKAKNVTELFEAPFVIRRGERVFLVYSAGGRWSDLGHLRIREYVGSGKTPCMNASWSQDAPRLLASGNKITGSDIRTYDYAAYGPGHASFFESPDGTELWCAFHAKLKANPGTGPVDVLLFLQKVEFDDTGFPQLGNPELAPLGLDTIAPSGEPDLIQWLTTNH